MEDIQTNPAATDAAPTPVAGAITDTAANVLTVSNSNDAVKQPENPASPDVSQSIQAGPGIQLGALFTPADQSADLPPAGELQSDVDAPADSEQLKLLRKIDENTTDLLAKMESIEARAARHGAIAGGVAGGVSGGIVALGLSFIKHKLGF